MPVGSPLLDAYDQTGIVKPALKHALDMTSQRLFPPLGTPMVGQPAGAPPPQAEQGETAPPQPSPVRPPGAGAVPPAAPQSPAAQNLARLTAPPQTGDLAHTKADTGQSGINQIHNPWVRHPLQILDAIGSAFLPSLTMGLPGTALHHQILTGQAAQNVGRENEQATGEAQRKHLESQTEDQQAQAYQRLHPKPEKLTNAFELWAKQNPDAKAGDWLKLQTENRPDKAETPFSVWREQNPNAKAEDWLKLEKPHAPSEYEDFKEGYMKQHPEATSDQVVQEFSTTKRAPQKQSTEDKILDEHIAKVHPGETLADARQHTAVKNPTDHGATVIDPQSGQVVRLTPGMQAPEGFRTVNQQGTQNSPTIQMRNVSAQASLVHEQTPHMLAEVDRLKDKLGPVQGRWNEFMQGKVGLQDPDMSGLRTDLLMYSSAVALMHARGRLPENLREEFDRAINAPKQDFKNLKAIITRIDDWTTKNMNAMGAGGNSGGGSKAEEWVRDASGKLVKK